MGRVARVYYITQHVIEVPEDTMKTFTTPVMLDDFCKEAVKDVEPRGSYVHGISYFTPNGKAAEVADPESFPEAHEQDNAEA